MFFDLGDFNFEVNVEFTQLVNVKDCTEAIYDASDKQISVKENKDK